MERLLRNVTGVLFAVIILAGCATTMPLQKSLAVSDIDSIVGRWAGFFDYNTGVVGG